MTRTDLIAVVLVILALLLFAASLVRWVRHDRAVEEQARQSQREMDEEAYVRAWQSWQRARQTGHSHPLSRTLTPEWLRPEREPDRGSGR